MASAGGAARKRKKNQEKKYEGEEGKKKNPFEINNEEARGIEQDLFAREPPSKRSQAGEGETIRELVENELETAEEDQSDRGAKEGRAGKSTQDYATKQPAWIDDDEEGIHVDIQAEPRLRKLRRTAEEGSVGGNEYVQRLRQQQEELNPRTGWARASREEWGRDGLGEILRSAREVDNMGSLGRGGKLSPGKIEAVRVRDANAEAPSNAVVQSVDFHESGQLLLTAGYDRRVRLFQIDGTRNPFLEAIFLEDMPVSQAAFTGRGREVLASGHRPYAYLCDLERGSVEKVRGLSAKAGRSLPRFSTGPAGTPAEGMAAFPGEDGTVALLSLQSRQCAGSFKINGSATCTAFTSEGRELMAAGSDGTAYVFDLRQRKCTRTIPDEGCLRACSLASTIDGKAFAVGQESGVVNLYRGYSPNKPFKSLFNLVTPADVLQFSPCGQMLALGSTDKKDALKLAHVETGTVFSNWPTSKSPLHYVSSFSFSPHCGFFAVGNARGRVLLYRLNHFSRA